MELTGTIKKLFDAKDIRASFRKRELVLTTDERYPQDILVEFTQDKIALLDRHKEGEQVTININIRGREWTSPRGEVKYFVSIQGWRIGAPATQAASRGDEEPAFGGGGGMPAGAPPFDDAPPPDSPNGGGAPMRDDDIPF